MERFVLGIISLEHLSMSLYLPVRALAYIYVDRDIISFDSEEDLEGDHHGSRAFCCCTHVVT